MSSSPPFPSARTLRILISSPNDVKPERDLARQIIDGLRRRYVGQFLLKPVLWEDLPLQPDISFQEGIERLLSADGGVDVAVFVLWSRFGMPLGEGIRREDGTPYGSGTEREYDLMVQARIQSGGSRPDILFYTRKDKVSFDERLRDKSTDEQTELLKQKKLVEAFIEAQSKDASTGANKAAFLSYRSVGEFSRSLRVHLESLLDRKALGLPQETIWDITKQGAPFMGLESFGPDHADVFFGREDEVLEARQALREKARNGCAFLLLSGASGSGKSSLACAGVLPAIRDYETDEQVAGWRTLVLAPSDLSPDPIAALVQRLGSDQVLPEIRGDSKAFESLAADLRQHPAVVCNQAIKPAFVRASKSHQGEVRLFLVLDQLEELFASSTISANDRTTFLEVVESLALSGSVWVLATVRADFYEQIQSEDALVRMKSGNGQLDVLPPGADALRRMVEEPARLAGLRFEERTVQSDRHTLSDDILGDAAEHAELLPLVEDVLRELYEKRVDGVLTFAAYQELGGSVEGALGRRAEKVFGALPADVQAALASVLEAVVTLGHSHEDSTEQESRDGAAMTEERVVRQRALMTEFPEKSSRRALVEKFTAERLFITGQHPETKAATVTVAHESLLRAWPRAADWAAGNQEFLRVRARVAARMREKEDGVILEGDPLLDYAQAQLASNPGGFKDDQRAYVESSVRVAKAARSSRQRLRLALGAGVMLAILSTILYFSWQRERDALARQFAAEAERNLGVRDYARAEIAAAQSLLYQDAAGTRELLLRARSGGISFVSSSLQQAKPALLTAFSHNGKFMAAVLSDRAGKPVTVEASLTKDGSSLGAIDITSFKGLPECVTITQGGDETVLLAMARPDHSVAIWRLAPSRQPRKPQELALQEGSTGRHSKRVPSLAFHPSKPWIATCSEDKKICLWDFSQEPARLIWEKKNAHSTAVHGIAMNQDGTQLASGGGDYAAKIWSLKDITASYDGSPRFHARPELSDVEPATVLEGHSDSVFSVAFSPDGKRLASGGYDRLIRIWDLTLKAGEKGDTHPTVGTLYGTEGTVLDLAFSADGKLLFSGGKDEMIRVWDAAEGRVLVALRPECGVIRSVSCMAFADDIRCGGETGWSVWSARGRDVAARLWNGAPVGAIVFDPAGRFVAAGGSDGSVHVWDQKLHLAKTLETKKFQDASSRGVNGLAMSADGHWLAAAGEGMVVNIWDATNWQPVKPLEEDLMPKADHDGAIWGLCFDPKGRWLASGNTDDNKRIKRWNMGDWTLKDQTSDPALNDSVYALACDAEGRWLVSGDSLAQVTVRRTTDLSTMGKPEINVRTGETNVWSVAVIPEPLSILSGNSDGRVYRWIPKDSEWPGGQNGEKIKISDSDAKVNHTINSISYSAQNKWIAAGGDGGSVELYDVDLKRVRSLVGHDGTVWYVAFDRKGTRLASGGSDKIVRVWDMDEMKRNLKSDSPATLYEESRKMTGMSVEDGRIVFTRPK